jgi:hypothetical protein
MVIYKVEMVKKKQNRIKLLAGIIMFSLIAWLIYFGYSQYQYSKLSDEEAVRQEFERVMATEENKLLPNEMLVIQDLRFEDEWARAEVLVVDSQTGQNTVGEATIVIFRKVNSKWTMAKPGSDLEEEWLEMVPESLIPQDLKIWLR